MSATSAFNSLRKRWTQGLLALALGAAGSLVGAEAKFLRGINLNGPALIIEGRAWEAGAEAPNFKATGKTFANQRVALKPPTDAARAQMIRSSVWGNKVELVLSNLEPGEYQLFLYVWEDNHDEQFDLIVNGNVVTAQFHSGSAGMWKRLGPWRAMSIDGRISVSAKGPSHGAANLSGLEVWSGDGPVPEMKAAHFADAPTAEQLSFFESKIRPVLVENCYECHSANAKKLKGGLLLDSLAGVRKGGNTGVAITPGDPEASLLIEALRHATDLAMPPENKLPPRVIADFESWVQMGAPDPRTTDTVAAMQAKEGIDWEKARTWWAFRPLAPVTPPAVKATRWPANDIDRFILSRLESAKYTPAEDADRRALIRRVTYDLIGLPPTPEEIAAFVSDKSPGAFARVVDRLLESPHYGERWGRHWLDVVRYADTAGDNSDYPIPQMHFYRDWVISAFNRDMPYDEFVRDQLAGDLRSSATPEECQERIIATGYVATARRFGSRVDDYPQHLTIEDTIDNLGRSFLGLTISCARCHDHKFDPISTKDYYAIYGIFHSTRYPWPGIELDKKQRDFVPLVASEKMKEAESTLRARKTEQTRLDKEVERLRELLKNAPAEEKKGLQAQIRDAEKNSLEHVRMPVPFKLAYAVAEGAKPSDAAVQHKGDPAKPGEKVPRRFLTVLGAPELEPEAKGSGRAQLAEWILATNNPLPARVMANRIWQHHFGRGIVPTPNDFGRQGKAPSHPELLDYLATKFRESGWSIKALHRLILLSRTYQMGSKRDANALAADPGNELLASFPRRRLDAESIRDTLLVLGGNLDHSPAGAHPFPAQHEWKFTQHNPFKAIYESSRRSVYLMTQRIQRHPYLAIFDGADPSTSTAARANSTTPLQALYLLNDSFVHEQSRRLAGRVMARTRDDLSRIEFIYPLVLGRAPEAVERQAAKEFLDRARGQLREDGVLAVELDSEAWSAYVRVLFRLNEFVYLD